MRIGIVGAAASNTDDDVQNYFDRLTSDVPVHRAAVEALILGLKEDSVWAEIDEFSIVGPNEADSLLDVKGTGTTDSTKNGSPFFTANQGFTMHNDNVILTGTPLGLLPQFDIYGGHAFVYMRGELVNYNHFIMDGQESGTINMQQYNFSTDHMEFTAKLGRADQATLLDETDPAVSGEGFFGASQAVSIRNMVLNDFTQSDSAGWDTPSLSVTDKPCIGAESVGGGTYDVPLGGGGVQFSAWGFGDYLTLVQLRAYEDRIRAYMTALGTAVY